MSALLVSDDIIVLDSHSTDGTVDKALNLGARVIKRQFDGWASHQNWAVNNITFANEWVLYIDADERIDDQLSSEIIDLEPAPSVRAYKLFRDNRFLNGEKLKYSMACPGIVRLFCPEYVRYERDINPICIVDGDIQCLKNTLTHYNFSTSSRASG